MTKRNATYQLGIIIDGQPYVYTGLGTFRSVTAAAKRSDVRGTLVFRTQECWRHGVCYGTTAPEVVATVV